MKIQETQEGQRLEQAAQQKMHWKRWGSYLSDRQWGTVREDYSADGDAWDYFPHDQARSRAYRWGEDGIAGLCDTLQRLCFALAFWNGEDDILKERPFGLTNGEGNHGEDVKEYYFYLDNTPTHSYMKCLYKYPHHKFPYANLVEENGRRKADPWSAEYELLDTGIFDGNAYCDVLVEYAKQAPDDIAIQISVTNRGTERRTLHLLPTLWFRNTWSWFPDAHKPGLQARTSHDSDYQIIEATSVDADLGKHWLYCEKPQEVLYTENETDRARFGWGANASPYVKDAFERYVIRGQKEAVNPKQAGTKAAAYYVLDIDAGETHIVRLRLSDSDQLAHPFDASFATIFTERKREADEFYQAITPWQLSDDRRNVQRQAFAGMLWCKQCYYYSVQEWLDGDPTQPPPPEGHKTGRNHEWTHLFAQEVLSMPDTWEYPWFAAWDLAFHTITLALIDPAFAKRQLSLMTRAWYMHPNGQLPAYEWSFGDVNPPVHAWAAWRVYKIEQKMYGQADRAFLESVFQQLLFYFNWWLNRKDIEGNNLFQGGFLGLDNVGPFDRSNIPADISGYLDQSDGTSWMGMYCLNMLRIAMELATYDRVYEEMASKFFLHFLAIARSINRVGGDGAHLWDEDDGFFYDVLHLTDGRRVDGQAYISLKVRSVTGLVPLFAVEAIDQKLLQSGSGADLKRLIDWVMQRRPDLIEHSDVSMQPTSEQFMQGLFLSLVGPDKLKRILQKMLDEQEFLSPHGIRSVSKYHEQHPFIVPGITDAQGRP